MKALDSLIRRHSRALELALVVALMVAATLSWQQRLGHRFSIDESAWISTSRYYWTTLVERDVFGPAWQPNYVVLTQPPVHRYLLGFGLALQGWRPDQLNGLYDSHRNRAFNERAGNVPGPELLAAARRVVFLIALGVVAVIYAVGRTLGGPFAGAVAVGLTVTNPLLATLWSRALAEATLACFSLMALLLALRFVPQPRPGRVGMMQAVATGAALGLATATKLSGILGGVGLALFGLLQQATALRRDGRPVGIGAWIHLGLAAALVFVLVNPLLYPDPIGRAVLLFQHRRDEMRQQQQTWPDWAVPDDLRTRAQLVAQRALGRYTSLPSIGGLPLDGPLAAAGIVIAAARTWRELRRGHPPGPLALLLCWALASYALTVLNLGLDSSHYYAPLVVLIVLFESLAVSVGSLWLVRWARNVQVLARYRAGRRAPPTRRGPHADSGEWLDGNPSVEQTGSRCRCLLPQTPMSRPPGAPGPPRRPPEPSSPTPALIPPDEAGRQPWWRRWWLALSGA